MNLFGFLSVDLLRPSNFEFRIGIARGASLLNVARGLLLLARGGVHC